MAAEISVTIQKTYRYIAKGMSRPGDLVMQAVARRTVIRSPLIHSADLLRFSSLKCTREHRK